jgi:transcriptional regulator with XRE-family HTH domain
MDKTIGRIVRELMLEHELSYDELARIAGLSHFTLRGIVQGRIRKPHPRTIAKLARAFGRDPKEFADFLGVENT